MKKHTLSIIFGVTALMASTMVGANEKNVKVIPDFSSDILVLEGQVTAKEQVTVMVFPDGTTLENYWSKIPQENIKETVAMNGTTELATTVANPGNVVSFVDDFYADIDGDFSYKIGLKKSGTYDVYMLYSNSGETKIIEDVWFSASGDYFDKIKELNKMDKSAFINAVTDKETQKLLGFDDEINSLVDEEEIAGVLYESMGEDGLSENFTDNLSLYKLSGAIVALNDGKNVDVEYLDYAIEKDEKIADYVENYTQGNAICDRLKNKEIEDLEDLLRYIKSELVLMVVENPNGYDNIKKAFEDFSDVLGIKSPTSDKKVYSKLAGEKFDSLSELKEAYKDALSDGNTGGGNSGGSGSGGSGKKPSYSVQPSTTENTIPDTINKNIFDDLDTVSWAQEAIVNLSAKGVINGKSDNIFAPNDYITREEFTKLITAALADDIEPANITFTDVYEGSWSYDYIAKAKAAGFINGYSDTYFGAKDLITRQDMAKIIYGAAKYKNIKVPTAENVPAFADDSEIADYAKEAVYSLKEMEIINGVDKMHFAPTSNATRAQAAVMIYRLLLK